MDEIRICWGTEVTIVDLKGFFADLSGNYFCCKFCVIFEYHVESEKAEVHLRDHVYVIIVKLSRALSLNFRL